MTELPPAADQLIQQVTEVDENATCEPVGEPDGFGVTRDIKFDKATSKWLAPALEAIADDRIAATNLKGKAKELVVTFVPDVRADFRDGFPLNEVLEVLTEDEPQ
jgi:hypothetical protein